MADTPTTCPACGAGPVLELTNTLLCASCRREWSPDMPPAANGTNETSGVVDLPTTANIAHAEQVTAAAWPMETAARDGLLDYIDELQAAEVATAGTVDDVLAVPADERAARDAQAYLDALSGTEIELDGGQRAWIVDFPDDDHVRVTFSLDPFAAEIATVDLNDVVRQIVAAPEAVDVDDGTARTLAGAAATVAVLCLRAGVETVDVSGPVPALTMPPDRWLPDDPQILPMVEQGVAYAIATLIVALNLPVGTVEHLIETLTTNAQAGTEQETRNNGE